MIHYARRESASSTVLEACVGTNIQNRGLLSIGNSFGYHEVSLSCFCLKISTRLVQTLSVQLTKNNDLGLMSIPSSVASATLGFRRLSRLRPTRLGFLVPWPLLLQQYQQKMSISPPCCLTIREETRKSRHHRTEAFNIQPKSNL